MPFRCPWRYISPFCARLYIQYYSKPRPRKGDLPAARTLAVPAPAPPRGAIVPAGRRRPRNLIQRCERAPPCCSATSPPPSGSPWRSCSGGAPGSGGAAEKPREPPGGLLGRCPHERGGGIFHRLSGHSRSHRATSGIPVRVAFCPAAMKDGLPQARVSFCDIPQTQRSELAHSSLYRACR